MYFKSMDDGNYVSLMFSVNVKAFIYLKSSRAFEKLFMTILGLVRSTVINKVCEAHYGRR